MPGGQNETREDRLHTDTSGRGDGTSHVASIDCESRPTDTKSMQLSSAALKVDSVQLPHKPRK